MSRKSWRNKNYNDVKKQSPQKFNWKPHKIFEDYPSADVERSKLLEGGKKFVKIHRCGPEGTKFKVKIGHPVKTKKEDVDNEE